MAASERSWELLPICAAGLDWRGEHLPLAPTNLWPGLFLVRRGAGALSSKKSFLTGPGFNELAGEMGSGPREGRPRLAPPQYGTAGASSPSHVTPRSRLLSLSSQPWPWPPLRSLWVMVGASTV